MLREFMSSGYDSYRAAEWIVLFFIYGFLGWIWESTYMSLLEHRRQNRGFLLGPFIPIYGFGATLVLYVTMPFYNCWWKVALIGMLVGTMMEEMAGRIMYVVFQEKYWSYEGYPGNIDGFICVPATILWGFFSVFSLYFLNRPFDYFVRNTPYDILVIISVIGIFLIILDIRSTIKRELDVERLMVPIRGGFYRISQHFDIHMYLQSRQHWHILSRIRKMKRIKNKEIKMNTWIKKGKNKINRKK